MSLLFKLFSFYNLIKFLAILYPTSLANLVVEVGTSKVTRTYCIVVWNDKICIMICLILFLCMRSILWSHS